MNDELIESVTVAGDLLTVPLIVFRRFRRPVVGLVERIYEMNVGLADLGPYLPPGTTFLMPVSDAGQANPAPVTLDPIRLW
jgi:phage tail protein X